MIPREKTDTIVIHCADTPDDRDVDMATIKKWHVEEKNTPVTWSITDPYATLKKTVEFTQSPDWTKNWSIALMEYEEKDAKFVKFCPVCAREATESPEHPWLCGTCLTSAWKYMTIDRYKLLAPYIPHWPRRVHFKLVPLSKEVVK